MKPTLNWFDKLMLAITYAEENAYETCLAPKGSKTPARSTGNHPAPRGLGHGLHAKAGA